MEGELYPGIDTPALLIDLDRLEGNLRRMQEKADLAGVGMRPHTKTHRTPEIAKLQLALGARGITVSKLGEAEVMAAAGLDDIFVANEIVGRLKMERLGRLAKALGHLAVGVDHPEQVAALSEALLGQPRPVDVLVDVETGNARTGVGPGEPALKLARCVSEAPGLKFAGIFTHDGQSYSAGSAEEARAIGRRSQELMLETAGLIRSSGLPVDVVSVGSSPSLLLGEILPGVTEIRPGNYAFLDANMAQFLGTYDRCAQTVLATVISRPTPGRVVLDAGTKSLNEGVQKGGITRAEGHGRLKEHPEIFLERIFEEHSSFTVPEGLGLEFPIGTRLEIIPNHACQTTNFYGTLYGMRKGQVETAWPVSCMGKSQ